jgi:prolyl oligopeptidase
MNSIPLHMQIKAEPARDFLHGVEVQDHFRWLEDKDSPATRAFIHAEQQTYRDYLNCHQDLRMRIERRVTELLTVPSIDLPITDHRGGLLYLKRLAEEEQKAIYHRHETNAERLLISVTMLGMDSYTSLSIIQVSSDGRFLVFGIRNGGDDVQEIGIYDLVEQRLLPDRLPRGFYRGLVFDRNASGFYYVQEEAAGPYRFRRAVRRHEFGRDHGADLEIYCAGDDPAKRLMVQGAEDGSALGYLILSLESSPKARFLIHEFPLNKGPEEIVPPTNASFGIRFWTGTIEASTTYAAPRGRVVRFSCNDSEPHAWHEVIPESSECLYSWEPCGESSVVHYTDGSRKLTRIYSESGKLIRTIEYPTAGTSIPGLVDVFNRRLFYSYSDITQPPSIYAVDLHTGEHHVWWCGSILGQHKAIEVESRTYSSNDGVEIPITLIHPRGAKGIRPVLLSAYGGGGVCTTPRFSVLVTILVEAGFTCATAHVRGGGEGGEEWRLAGQRERKQTSVEDLMYAARCLMAIGYTTQDCIGVAGQSSGALLTLCALTQHPELFRAALALGPLADLARFHLFGVARGFVAELGSPDVASEFAALYELSPYHRVRQGVTYPAVLIVSGDRDKRCDSLHARKMIARLR